MFEIILCSVTAVAAITNHTSGAVAMFAVSCAIYICSSILDRKKHDDLADIKADIEKLKQKIESISFAQGFKRQ